MPSAMASGKSGLTDLKIKKLRTPAKRTRHYDCKGLFFIHDPSGAERWVVRIHVQSKVRDIALCGYPDIGLADARDLAHDIRRKVKSGENPVAARRALRETIPTFEDCALSKLLC